jgi:hypothetical protein
VKQAPTQPLTPRASAASASPPSGPIIGVRPQGLFYDDVPLCPEGTLCRPHPDSLLILPLVDKVQKWRNRVPSSAMLTVLVDPSLGYAALADVVGTLSNAGEEGFLLGSASSGHWTVKIWHIDEHGPYFHLEGGGAFNVSRDVSFLDRNCDRPAPQLVPMTLDADLSRCLDGLSHGPPHGTVNFFVRRRVTIGELLRILDALGNDKAVALSIAL